MSCKRINLTKKKICIGNLKHSITLLVRSITAPDDFDYDMNFTTLANVWAGIETKQKGVEIFNDVNISIGVATHFFYIRYRDDVTAQNFIEYNSKKFRILEVTNIDETNDYMLLSCAERGDSTTQAAYV